MIQQTTLSEKIRRVGCAILAVYTFAYPLSSDAVENEPDLFSEPAPLPHAYQELRFARSFEAGTTDRLLLDAQERFRLSPAISLDATLGVSAFDQGGLSLVGASAVGHLVNARADLFLSWMHERWSGWQVSENRALMGLDFHPYHFVSAVFGIAYRAPTFESTTLSQALSWSSASPELQVVYRFEWVFAEWSLSTAPAASASNVTEPRRPANLALWIYDWDRYRLWTASNIHFALAPEFQLQPGLKLTGLVSTAIKGLSGGVVSWAEDAISLGVRHDF